MLGVRLDRLRHVLDLIEQDDSRQRSETEIVNEPLRSDPPRRIYAIVDFFLRLAVVSTTVSRPVDRSEKRGEQYVEAVDVPRLVAETEQHQQRHYRAEDAGD